MLVLVVDAHRPAHRDDRVDAGEARRQRLSLVELDAMQRGAALAQHVLEDAGRLARDVLEDEDVHAGSTVPDGRRFGDAAG